MQIEQYTIADTINKAVDLLLKKHQHQDYTRTIELARMYRAFTTGDDLEYLLRRFDRRESAADFDQANRIAQQIAPAITSALTNPARKLTGLRPIVDQVDYGKPNDPKAKALNDILEQWYGGKDVDGFIASLIDPSDIDPNSFTLLAFNDFDFRFEKPITYPVHIPCANVYGFEYINTELQWLWLSYDVKYTARVGMGTPDEVRSGKRWILYTPNFHVVFNPTDPELLPTPTMGMLLGVVTDTQGLPLTKEPVYGADGYIIRASEKEAYMVKMYDHNSGRVPAFRNGCKADASTDGRTMVNRWHDAVPYLKKSLKQVREMDLTTALHAFPQKIQYVSKCKAPNCNGGKMPSGDDCGTCKGEGIQTIGTAQDHINLTMPRSPDEMFDPTKIAHYVAVPVDLIQQMRDIVKDTRADCFRAVYGFDIYGGGQTGKTYEEVIAMNQAIYDALSPFAAWWSTVHCKTIHIIAAFNDMDKGLIVVHHFPRNFRFETSADIVKLMSEARTAGAPKSFLANLSGALVLQAFGDDPVALKRAETQAKFDPFPGMSESAVLAAISGGKTTERSALLWMEMAEVFRKCEAKYTGEVSFYDLVESKQSDVINEVLAEMLATQEEAAAPVPFPPTGTTEDAEDPDAEEEVQEEEEVMNNE